MFSRRSSVGFVEQAELHGRWELELTSVREPSAHIHEQQVTVHVSHGAIQRSVEAFWDGGRCWRVRFSPTREGLWTWLTEATAPFDSGLHGREGQFLCVKSERPSPWLQHGPLTVSSNGRHLCHDDGKPFLWIGDTAWNGLLKSTDADWTGYLEDRQRKGFSVIQCVLAPWMGATGDAEGRPAYTGQEPIHLEPAFFQRLDQRMDRIAAAGLVAAPVLAWTASWNRDSLHLNPGTSLPDDQLVRLIRYMVSRYSAHPVVWILAGDGIYDEKEAERWRRIGRAALANSSNLATLHPAARLWVANLFEHESWYRLHGYQSGQWDDSEQAQWMTTGPPAQQPIPPMPSIDLEPCYEDHRPLQTVGTDEVRRTDALAVRRACWWSLLSGAVAGVSYGAHGVWSWESFPALPLSHPDSGIARPWREAMHLPGSTAIAHMATLLRSTTWWHLSAAPEALAEQPGHTSALRFIAAACTPQRDLALLYAPEGGRICLTEGFFAPGLEVLLLDPATGEVLWRSHLAEGASVLECGTSHDCILLLRSTGALRSEQA